MPGGIPVPLLIAFYFHRFHDVHTCHSLHNTRCFILNKLSAQSQMFLKCFLKFLKLLITTKTDDKLVQPAVYQITKSRQSPV